MSLIISVLTRNAPCVVFPIYFAEVLWKLVLFTFWAESGRCVLLVFAFFFASSAFLMVFPVLGFDEVLQRLVVIAPRAIALFLGSFLCLRSSLFASSAFLVVFPHIDAYVFGFHVFIYS